jgi:hypothetical protein
MAKNIKNNFIDFINGTECGIRTLLRGKRSTLADANKDKPVLIMGNGPSLKEIDVECFKKNCLVCCVNFFPCQSEQFGLLKPEYYCAIDPTFFADESSLNKATLKRRNDLMETFQKVNWPLKIITLQGKKFPVDNQYISYEYLSGNGLCAEYAKKYIHFLYRNNLAVCGLQNVMIAALNYFVLKKFDLVYLAGLDMSEFRSFSIDKRNHILAEYQHFYGNEYVDVTEERQKTGEFYKRMKAYTKMFEQFYFLKEFADKQGTTVYNLTVNSYVDVFEKKDWKEALDVRK